MGKLDLIKNKIFSIEGIKKQVAMWRFQGKKIVFSNGCFDIIHLGHIEYLTSAADLGRVLIIGVNTDASVTKLKGPHRPINDEISRSIALASLSFVNAVVLFDEETPAELIQLIQPDILVKGNDYQTKDIVGRDVVEARGGQVVTIPLTEGYSTSRIEEKILRSHKK